MFLWRHVRHINLVEEHPGKILKNDRRIASNLNYEGIEFPVQEKDFKKIEVQNNICMNVFGYENELVYPIFISKQTFENSIDLSLLIENDKSQNVYIKDFNTFIFHKTRNKNKKWFCKSCLQCFSSKNVLIKHKEDCLSINGMQSVDVEEGIIKFENYSNQLSVPFKIYADFECNSKDTEIYEGSCTKKYHDHVLCNYTLKVVCIDNTFSKPIVVYRGENAAYEFVKAILKEYKYCKNIMKKHFNKNLIMSEEQEHLFQQNNSCWICKKLINDDNEKVRDHCHITSKFSRAAYQSYNLNFQLTKRIPVIFHNLKGYDSHLIFSVVHKFNLKINVIQNGLEKHKAFFLNKNLPFIDSMQFTNSSLDKLDKNLSDEDFKYLVEEFDSKHLKILKQKGDYPYEYMNSFKKFDEDKLPARKYFFSSTKKGKIDNDGKISDGHISIENYLMCEKIWNKLEMKNMGDYHDRYLKKDVLLLADVFERCTCLKHYELDPCHYFSSPGFSWDAMLKMTKIELEKISDIGKYLFIEKGTKGGVSYIAKRYAKANNKYMNDYDPEKPSTFITYLDKNNLLGQ